MSTKEDLEIQKMYLCKDFSNANFEHLSQDFLYIDMIKIFFLIQEGKFTQADEILSALSEFKSESSLFFLNLILLSLKDGQVDFDKIDQYIELGSECNDTLGKRWLFFELYKLYAEQDMGYAQSLIEDVLEIDCDFLPAVLEKACSIDFYEEPEKAVASLEDLKGKVGCPNFFLLCTLGLAYLEQGEWLSAGNAFNESVNIEENEESYFGLAMIEHFYNPKPNPAQALKYYNSALAINPYFYQARVGVLKLLSEQNEAKKFQIFLKETLDVEQHSFENLLDVIFLLEEVGVLEYFEEVALMLVELEPTFDIDYLKFLIDAKKADMPYSEVVKTLDKIKEEVQQRLFKTIIEKIYYEE